MAGGRPCRSACSLVPKLAAEDKVQGAKRNPDPAFSNGALHATERSDQIEGTAAMRARSPPTQRACDDDPGSRGAPGGRFVA